MKTEKYQNDRTSVLRANIGIIKRGRAATTDTFQNIDPILLQGLELPAEANYEFVDPTHNSSYIWATMIRQLSPT